MNYQKKFKAISRKGLTNDLMNKFSILNEAKYFSSGIFQNYLVFIPVKKYLKYFSGTTWIASRKSNGTLEKNIENITKSVSNFAPTFVDHHLLPEISTDFTLGNCLLGSVKLTKHADLTKYKCTGCGIRFDSRSDSSLSDGSMGNNVIIFGAGMS